MDQQVLTRAFATLQTSESRKEALASLFQNLSPHEWRHAQDLLNARNWQRDIVGSLPIELVAHVFSYLDPSTPFRLQQVSRTWHTILRSVDVLNSNLDKWYHGTAQLEGLHYEQYKHKAQSVHRFRSGRHVDIAHKGADYVSLPNFRTQLVGETLVGMCRTWLTTVSVTNLRTGTFRELHGDARESIDRLSVSDEVIAFTTRTNVCYVFDLTGDRKSKFRIPPFLSSMACCGHTVVCAGVLPNYAEVYIWDFETQRGKTFRVGRDQPPFAVRNGCQTPYSNELMILPNPRNQTLIIFASDRCLERLCTFCCHDRTGSTEWGTVHYALFTFEGRLLKYDEIKIDRVSRINSRADVKLSYIRPTARRGKYCLAVSIYEIARRQSHDMLFQFDEEEFAFVDPQAPWAIQNAREVKGKIAWWNDTFYQAHPDPNTTIAPGKQHGTPNRVSDIWLKCLGQREIPTAVPFLNSGKARWIALEWDKQRSIVTQLLLNDRFAVVTNTATQSLDVVAFEKEPKTSEAS